MTPQTTTDEEGVVRIRPDPSGSPRCLAVYSAATLTWPIVLKEYVSAHGVARHGRQGRKDAYGWATLPHMTRSAFTLLEALVVIGIIALLAGLSTPFVRQLLIRGDVQRSAEQVIQALARAQTLSQNGEGGSAWGFHVPTGTLFQGNSYDTRDPQYDESYPMPPTITASGSLTEVTYSRLEGKPSATGSILLLGLENERESILITISAEGIPILFPDRLTICHCQGHDARTLHIPDNAWPAHERHGDHLGACENYVDPCD